MNFDLSEDQRALKSTVERLMSREYTFESRAKYAMETIGWSGAVSTGTAAMEPIWTR
jgi:hypothetical protein